MTISRCGSVLAARGLRSAMTGSALTALLVSGCTSGRPGHGGARAHLGTAGPATAAPAEPAVTLRVTPAPYQLPAALSREVVLSSGNALLIVDGTGASTDSVTRLDPVTGTVRAIGRQAEPVHASPGTTAVTAGSLAYLVGGDSVLATTDGGRSRVTARLPVPVRYAAAVAGPGGIWVFGGQTSSGATNVIQRIDPAGTGTGAAVVAGHLPRPVLGATAIALDGLIYVAGGVLSRTVYRFDPATSHVAVAGALPEPTAYAAGAVVGGIGYLIGGQDGGRVLSSVTTLRVVPAGQAIPDGATAPWQGPATGPGHLSARSDPSALPADVLIADHRNNRLLIVDPRGRIRWEFPKPGDLARGQTFLAPDDAFFSADGQHIVATQEDDQVISVISLATNRIVYRYGVPGVPGASPDHLSNPDDAMLSPRGVIIAADIRNCRVVLITPPAHVLTRAIGKTTQFCAHDPPRWFGSPNGAFPMTDGHYLVTEINGDWADEMSLSGTVAWSSHPPGVAYPSDTNEVSPGRYLTADYSDPGQLVEFSQSGRLLWRLGGLNQPSLALPLPDGDILFNDDFNHRVCVVDPATDRIVWQYGHTGVPGRAPGYLDDPDGVDLVPPDSLVITHAATMGEP